MTRPNLKFLLLAITLGVNLGCGAAEAMGKKPSRSTPPPEPAPSTAVDPVGTNPPPPPLPPRPTTDRYRDGLALGSQNGARLIDQIRRTTIGTQGCAGQPAFEKALVAVTKSIRPPKPGSNGDLDLARGYFRGYAEAFGKALYDGRRECELPTVIAGSLPGTVVGSLLCGAGSVDVKLLDLVEIEPVYPGWAGGKGEAKSECSEVAVTIAEGCSIGKEEDRETVERVLTAQVAAGCAD
jgi:hypothetical protein